MLLAFRFYAALCIYCTSRPGNGQTGIVPGAHDAWRNVPSSTYQAESAFHSLQSHDTVALCCGCKFVEDEVQCNKKDESFLYRVNITAMDGGGDAKHPSCGEQKASAKPVMTDRMVFESVLLEG